MIERGHVPLAGSGMIAISMRYRHPPAGVGRLTSVKTYDMLHGKLELYRVGDGALTAVREGRRRPLAADMRDIRPGGADDSI